MADVRNGVGNAFPPTAPMLINHPADELARHRRPPHFAVARNHHARCQPLRFSVQAMRADGLKVYDTVARRSPATFGQQRQRTTVPMFGSVWRPNPELLLPC